MTDPLNDPRFPDRPTHPDYWRISEILLANDGDATEGGKTIPEITAAVVDIESLTYVAKQRAGLMCQALGLDPRLAIYLSTAWIDAFTAGATFQERGGHRHQP
jgi:hypothetical protein